MSNQIEEFWSEYRKQSWAYSKLFLVTNNGKKLFKICAGNEILIQLDSVFGKIRGINLMYDEVFGWGLTFGTTKCKTTDISKFPNFEYWKKERRVIRIFYLQIYSSFLYLFKLCKHSKYEIIYRLGNLWNFYGFPNCKILKMIYFSILYNFRNFRIFKIGKFGKL